MFRILSIVLRTLLMVIGTAVLLFVLSYPDSIIPPDPAMDYPHDFCLYDVRHYIWVAPWIFMEIVCALGSHSNRVWFTGLILVLVAGIISLPVLLATTPELVYPTFDYEDGKLAEGMGWLFLLLCLSFFVRVILGRFLFPEPLESRESENNHIEADALDPSRARTVAEIATSSDKVDPKFLFGAADAGLIAQFCSVLARMKRAQSIKFGSVILGIASLVAWFILYPQPSKQEALQRDLARMYDHVQSQGRQRATYTAVHAAYRVMKYIADTETFATYSPETASKWLGLHHVPESYRSLICDQEDMALPYINDDFVSRTRFLTISTGWDSGLHGKKASGLTAVLYIRTNKDGSTINISEVTANGWNKRADLNHWAIQTDLNTQFLRD